MVDIKPISYINKKLGQPSFKLLVFIHMLILPDVSPTPIKLSVDINTWLYHYAMQQSLQVKFALLH